MKKLLALSAMLLAVSGSAQAAYECVAPVINQSLSVQVRKSTSFRNCFDFGAIPPNTRINVLTSSKDAVTHAVKVNEIDSNSVIQNILQKTSVNGGTFFQIEPTTKHVAITIQPLSKLTTDKDYQVTWTMMNGEAQILIYVFNTNVTSTPPGSTCVPGTICTDPQSGTPPYTPEEKKNRRGRKIASNEEFGIDGGFILQAGACSSQQRAPAGKPPNFDTNEHLKKFKATKQQIDGTSVPEYAKSAMRAFVMAEAFAPGHPYDLKKNPQYGGSAAGNSAIAPFGNYFYGAAAAQMGYDLADSLKAGAVVQQWQNFTVGADKWDLGKFAVGLQVAISTGQGDNPDDVGPITGGHSYSTDIFNSDTSADTHQDSCSTTTKAPTLGGFAEGLFGFGIGGGWLPTPGAEFQIKSCFGKCTLTPSVTVIQGS